MIRRAWWQRPVTLRTVFWGAAAALLGSAAARDGRDLAPGILLAVGALIMLALFFAFSGAVTPSGDDVVDPAVLPSRDRLDELEARLAGQAMLEQRLLELEERLDFAERLLAERHDARIEGPSAS